MQEELEEMSELEPLLPPAPPIHPARRDRRRMNLDQLNTATQQLMGGLEWSEIRNGSPVNLFEALSETLGKPDFIESTEEDLTPSSLFLKFLSDAAGELCLARLDADLEGDGEPRLLILASPEDSLQSDPEAIEENLAALLLRFHGHSLSREAPLFRHWLWLYESAEFVSGTPLDAWRAVCVALFTHPDFYSY